MTSIREITISCGPIVGLFSVGIGIASRRYEFSYPKVSCGIVGMLTILFGIGWIMGNLTFKKKKTPISSILYDFMFRSAPAIGISYLNGMLLFYGGEILLKSNVAKMIKKD